MLGIYFLLRAVGVKVDVRYQSSQMFDDVIQGTVERSSDPKLRGSDQRKQNCYMSGNLVSSTQAVFVEE